jgi:hypothetical protein
VHAGEGRAQARSDAAQCSTVQLAADAVSHHHTGVRPVSFGEVQPSLEFVTGNRRDAYRGAANGELNKGQKPLADNYSSTDAHARPCAQDETEEGSRLARRAVE